MLSKKLRYKIKSELEITSQFMEGILYFSPFEKELYEECKIWFGGLINKPSYIPNEKYKVNIGRFVGVFPVRIRENKVEFSVDYYFEKSWKDWFIQEGDN